MSKSKILELVCVYQSSQGFISRTGALLGKQIFLKPCALAALTTVNMQPRPEWVAFVNHAPVPVRCVYADTKASDLFYVIRVSRKKGHWLWYQHRHSGQVQVHD